MGAVTYIIQPNWQGIGLGSALRQAMIAYAKSKGLSGFTADILAENPNLLKVFQQGEIVELLRVSFC